MPVQSRTLSEGNRLQRAYARWAEPWYARMPEDAREQARAIDAFLYSWPGLLVWPALAALVGLGALVLGRAGMPPGGAWTSSALFFIGLPLILLGAWLAPSQFATWPFRVPRRQVAPVVVGLAAAGLLTGFAVGLAERHGTLEFNTFMAALQRGAAPLGAALLLVSGSVLGLGWLAAELRRRQTAKALERLQLLAERDAATRDAQEARLRRLQAQIEPHFLFNTLSTLQHWVDTGDPRAGPLLREITGFLRRSTELLGADRVELADEAAAVGHYLAIQHARLGPRLASEIEIDPTLAQEAMPPGLLLTWVENAVEHGIEPALRGGTVRVLAQRVATGGWSVAVEDSGVGLAPGWAEGTGMANARQRVAHHFGASARVEVLLLAQGTGVRLMVDADAAPSASASSPMAAPAPAAAPPA